MLSSTMASHRLVGARQLPGLPREKDLESLEVQVVVAEVHKTRAREFAPDSTVFDFTGIDVVTKQRVTLYFYDAWASAVSFMDVGDEVTLKGIVVVDFPRSIYGNACTTSAADGACYLTPCGGNQSSVVVAQPAAEGDVIEVLVAPPLFDPVAKVKKGVHGMQSGVSIASGLDLRMSRTITIMCCA